MGRFWDAIRGHKALTVIIVVLILVCVSIACFKPNSSTISNRQIMMNSKTAALNENASPMEVGYAGGTKLSLPDGAQWDVAADKTSEYNLPRKMIENMSLSLEVKDVSKSMDYIARLAKQLNGYVVTSSITKNDTYYQGSITIKVPDDKMIQTADKVVKLGVLKNKSITADDVTEEFYDSQARLKALKKQEERLISFMDKAQKVSDLVVIEDKLTQVRSDIEVLEGRLRYLDNATSYSAISIQLIQGRTETVVAPKGTWGRAVQGLVGSINSLVAFINWLVVALFTIAPWLVPLAVIIIVFRYYKNRRRKNDAE